MGVRVDSHQVIALPKALEDLQKLYPNHVWATVPKDAELTKGWRNITYNELGHAVDGLARWVEANIGIGNTEDVVSYMGTNDCRYAACMIGLFKAGHVPMVPSTRNSPEGQHALFTGTGCTVLLHSEGVETQVETIRTAVPDLKTMQIPSFDVLLAEGSSSGPFRGRYSPAADTTALIVHTSGSTGLPKPIRWSVESLMTTYDFKSQPAPNGRAYAYQAFFETESPCLVMSPWFHAMGAEPLIASILCRLSLVMIPADKPPNGELIAKVVTQTKPSTGVFPPAILEQIVELPGGLDALAGLDSIMFGGAPLAQDVGDKISQVTLIAPIIGSTEAGAIASLRPSSKRDWQWFEWAPNAGIDMQPDADGLCEMVVLPSDLRLQRIFHTFPGIKEWRTKDLFARHPHNPDLWLYKGRKDDVLVLSNGEKLNPVMFEKTLEGHPLVQGALVVGQGRFQTGLLIEPSWGRITHETADDLLETLWPFIAEANKTSPGHGQVWKSKVAFSTRGKPFKRAPKGSTIRRQTTDLYHKEIDALYANEVNSDAVGKLPVDASLPSIKQFLRKVFEVNGFAVPEDAPDDSDIFNYGIDSLQVLALSATINHARGSKTMPASAIYRNATIQKLAEYLQGAHEHTNGTSASRESVMADMIEKYTRDLPAQTNGVSKTTSAAAQNGTTKSQTVILTGSTGSLGSYILQDLIASSDVISIYCLNRSPDAEARQTKLLTTRNIAPDFSKVTFLHTDFSQPRFGLSPEIYARLLDSATLFIHNAWAVDFNKSLPSYEDTHIAGTRRVVDFSVASHHHAQIVFISSIATVMNWRAVRPGEATIPEVSYDDNSLPAPTGYGESKHVASQILAAAAERCGVQSTVIRAGQLAGPSVEGGSEWNRHEWFPSLVRSSKALGVLPTELGNMNAIDWVPMDLAAKSVLDIAQSRFESKEEQGLRVAHLVNPQTSTWKDLVPAVRTALEREMGKEVALVSFAEWVEKLKGVPTTKEAAEGVPAVRLLEFFEGLLAVKEEQPGMETKQTVKISAMLKNMRAVDGELVGKWVAQWRD